jgi:AcrR family transcriptional regulator
MTGGGRGRRPGSSTTRGEILSAARELFARQGYENASLRAIARRAGVDVALIAHFFGSKQGLLREVLTPPVDPSQLIGNALVGAERDRMGEAFVRGVVSAWDAPAYNAALTGGLRTAVTNELAMTYLREMMMTTVVGAVSALSGDDRAGRRAELVAAQMIGVAMARYLLELPEVTAMTPDELARAVGPSVQHLLMAPLDSPDSTVPIDHVGNEVGDEPAGR